MLTWPEIILLCFVAASPFVIIGIVVYLLTGGLHSFALRPLKRCFEGIELHEALKPGDVSFVYHTYRGLLLWTTTNEHRVIAPAGDAQILLRRLLRFNLTWGMLGYGVILIPLLAFGNYFAQKRSIRDQLAAVERLKSPMGPPR